MTRPRTTLLAVVTAGALLVAACSSAEKSAPSADRQEVVAALVDDVITPGFTTAGASVATADDAVAAYCADPTPTSLEAATAAVDRALSDWERIDLVDMGPMMLLRTDSHVGYPVNAEKVEQLVVEGPPLDVTSVNERTASPTRGLTTAEYLLTDEPAPGGDPIRCGYLTAVAADASEEVAHAIQETVEGTPGTEAYHERLAGRGDDPIDADETIDVIVNMVLSALEKDAGALGDPGDQTEASVRRAAAAHLATVAALWGDGSVGLSRLVDGDLAARLRGELEEAQASVEDPTVPATTAQEAVDGVRATIGTEVTAALDVTVGFSDNDGDS